MANLNSSFATGAKSSIGVTALQILAAGKHGGVAGVQIKAANANTGIVYIGSASTVTAGSADTTDGFELAAGESLLIPTDNLDDIWAIASVAGQKVFWTVF